jgi:hypothetical protein
MGLPTLPVRLATLGWSLARGIVHALTRKGATGQQLRCSPATAGKSNSEGKLGQFPLLFAFRLKGIYWTHVGRV